MVILPKFGIKSNSEYTPLPTSRIIFPPILIVEWIGYNVKDGHAMVIPWCEFSLN